VPDLQAIFADTILKSELGPDEKDERVYDLNPVRSRQLKSLMIGSLQSYQRRPISGYSNSNWPAPEGESRSEDGNGNQNAGFFNIG
jgi:hypothetical protein